MLKVKELIKHLSKVDGDLNVGVVGHFGEFLHMDEADFYVTRAHVDESGKLGSWFDYWKILKEGAAKDILAICAPYKGVEPD